jgi:hypothetical protein
MRRNSPSLRVSFALVLSLASALTLLPSPASAQEPSPPVPTPAATASSFTLGGQLSLQSSARFDTRVQPFFSLRFIPQLKFTLAPSASASSSSGASRGVTFDGEFSANAYGASLFLPDRPASTSGDVKPYRAWLRLSTSRFEARIGLQKVSFGSATVFRPMMWFDSLDPRDPLQLTDGVCALLLRFYTKGNANVWAWTMYGNGDRRGFDLAPSDKKTPEFGGRVEVPLFKGELAATYHRRKAAIDGLVPVLDPLNPLPVDPVPEDRFGLDGKWDLGVGVWLEGALVHQRTTLLPAPYQLSLAAGLDYTFAVGRGLYALFEHFRIESSPRAFTAGLSRDISAAFVRYPLGLADDLAANVYYDWESRNLYRFLSWRRTSDDLTFTALVFWNPEDLLIFPGQAGSSSFAGAGVQLLLAYYF